MKQTASVLLWADSFHEGVWACQQIETLVLERSGSCRVEYVGGYLPIFTFEFDSKILEISIHGDYASWEPKPGQLEELLKWGKPDLVFVDDETDRILLAVEETAATPTGNQALQRCERQYGAAALGTPFWYLISEFGIHTDGGLRRDSVWPTMMGLEIMHATGVPSIVLHYSDADNPEDYESGEGTRRLFELVLRALENVTEKRQIFCGTDQMLSTQVDEMLDFVSRSWQRSLYLIGESDDAGIKETVASISAANAPSQYRQRGPFYEWPSRKELSADDELSQVPRNLIKQDVLAAGFEEDINQRNCYGVIRGSGSKPQPKSRLETWIASQNSLQSNWERENSQPTSGTQARLNILDFPLSSAGNHHVVTSPRILYLYDSTLQLAQQIEDCFPRLRGLLTQRFDQSPALAYITNSVKPGRIFGDPYTGQIASYAVTFGALSGQRNVFVYFPHQSIAQAAGHLSDRGNKGLKMLAELTSLLVFMGGWAIDTRRMEIL